jgi:hypothetical protein
MSFLHKSFKISKSIAVVLAWKRTTPRGSSAARDSVQEFVANRAEERTLSQTGPEEYRDEATQTREPILFIYLLGNHRDKNQSLQKMTNWRENPKPINGQNSLQGWWYNRSCFQETSTITRSFQAQELKIKLGAGVHYSYLWTRDPSDAHPSTSLRLNLRKAALRLRLQMSSIRKNSQPTIMQYCEHHPHIPPTRLAAAHRHRISPLSTLTQRCGRSPMQERRLGVEQGRPGLAAHRSSLLFGLHAITSFNR